MPISSFPSSAIISSRVRKKKKMSSESNIPGFISKAFERGCLSRQVPQYLFFASGVMIFFGIHNYLQEAIMNIEGFDYGVMLGTMEVLGVTVCSAFERHFIAKERTRVAPIRSFAALTMCLLSSSALSNVSLNYINFPTKVVFRSCKLIPTMFIGGIINGRIFSPSEYFAALFVCTGLVLFAAADWNNSPSFHPVGLVLVSASVVADSILPNVQERLFRLGSSRLEVTVFTNIFTLIVMTMSTAVSGDLQGTLRLAARDRQAALYMMTYISVSYVAISFHMHIVRRFGGVTAVLTATVRKAMTIALSFILFPKKFSWFYVMGTFMVLGGGLFASLSKRFGGTEAMKTKVSSIEDADEKDSAEEFKSLIPKSGVIELSLSPKKLGDESFDEIEMREVLGQKSSCSPHGKMV
mmetsp:Transcript_24970/g.38637  ORF Transcript_24970/g.38637 Transcript_24970/m.38637 type:complete len:410 (+) Transcript_24970:152-1381(+)